MQQYKNSLLQKFKLLFMSVTLLSLTACPDYKYATPGKLLGVEPVLPHTLASPTTSQAAQDSHPINELPMYGGRAKTSKMMEADHAFIAEVERTTTRKAAVKQLLAQSKHAMGANDLGLAMRRANQAWLLQPEDGRIYHQFASIMDMRGDAAAQIDPLWQRAAQMTPDDATLYRDWSIYLCRRDRQDECLATITRARELNPNMADIHGLTAAVRLSRGEYALAWASVKQARQHGEKIPDDLLKALSQKMPEPK